MSTRRLLSATLAWMLAAAAALGQATTNPATAAPGAAQAPQRYSGPLREGWWNDAVFYEVFVRSFADSAKGPLAGDGIGDLRGLIERLDYLNDGDPATTTDLGVTALWLMPITRSPSYHGYDTTDYRTVEPQYGANDDFKALIAECHKRGIRVVIDLVLNHCSDKHPWFAEARDPAGPRHGWFIWSDTRPDWKGPWNQTVWHPLNQPRSATGAGAGPYFYGCFGRDMPDLNYDNPAVTAEMRSVVRYWLSDMGADGFRLDAIRHLIEQGANQDSTPATHAWLREFYADYKKVNPQAFAVGEVWSTTDIIASYVGDQMDCAFEFPLAQALVDAARSQKAAGLAEALARAARSYPRNQFATFLTNHDQPRVMTQLKGDRAAARVAAGLLLTLPGVPFIYYGEEIGMSGDKPDPDIRTPMQWSAAPGAGFSTAAPWRAVNADASSVNVQAQSAQADSLLGWYRTLVRTRLEHPALRRGEFELIPSGSERVLAFRRWSGDERFIVLANLGDRAESAYALELPLHEMQRLSGARELLTDRPAVRGPKPLESLPPRSLNIILLAPPEK